MSDTEEQPVVEVEEVEAAEADEAPEAPAAPAEPMDVNTAVQVRIWRRRDGTRRMWSDPR